MGGEGGSYAPDSKVSHKTAGQRQQTVRLTLVDESDVLLVRGGEVLILLVVCGQRWSRVVVLLAVQAVENNLGRRDADGWKGKQIVTELMSYCVWH